MQILDEFGRPEAPFAADEVTLLNGFLDYQRATLGWKTRDLDDTGLRTTTANSTMTLGGLLKHMAWIEDHWFSYFLHGRQRTLPWREVNFSKDPDWEWTSSCEDSADELRNIWSISCEASRSAVSLALESGGVDQLSVRAMNNGERPSLRWILLHMIEEYARHNGHADLLREVVDGQVGE